MTVLRVCVCVLYICMCASDLLLFMIGQPQKCLSQLLSPPFTQSSSPAVHHTVALCRRSTESTPHLHFKHWNHWRAMRGVFRSEELFHSTKSSFHSLSPRFKHWEWSKFMERFQSSYFRVGTLLAEVNLEWRKRTVIGWTHEPMKQPAFY